MATEIREIDWATRRILTADRRSLPIVDIFDRMGRPLPSPDGAVLALAGAPGAWVTIKLGEFDRHQLQ